jgi:predicted negative regulator of RcsB-dependent stress response
MPWQVVVTTVVIVAFMIWNAWFGWRDYQKADQQERWDGI